MSQNSSRRQKAAKWAGKASLFAANQYLKHKQQQGETSPETEEKLAQTASETPPDKEKKLAQTASETPQETEEKLAQTASETPQEIQEKPEQKSRRQKLGKWGKQASLFAARAYLRRNNQQVSEQKKPTLLETFLNIILISVTAICAIALSILLLTLRFGYGVH